MHNVSQRRRAASVPRRPRISASDAATNPTAPADQGDATNFDGDEVRSDDGTDRGSDMDDFINGIAVKSNVIALQ